MDDHDRIGHGCTGPDVDHHRVDGEGVIEEREVAGVVKDGSK